MNDYFIIAYIDADDILLEKVFDAGRIRAETLGIFLEEGDQGVAVDFHRVGCLLEAVGKDLALAGQLPDAIPDHLGIKARFEGMDEVGHFCINRGDFTVEAFGGFGALGGQGLHDGIGCFFDHVTVQQLIMENGKDRGLDEVRFDVLGGAVMQPLFVCAGIELVFMAF